jgi:hypothetical protein
MNEEEFVAWVAMARAATQEKMAAARSRFGIGSHARYAVDLAAGTIRFYDEQEHEVAHASVQVAGSWSPSSESWMWGWENASLPSTASVKVLSVRSKGDEHGIAMLQHAFAPCDEGFAWSMASLAAELAEAQCVYRVVGAKSNMFLLLFGIGR